MPCLLLVIALLLPRVAMVLIFFFQVRWYEAVFQGWILPVLGFVFLPYTTLAYMAAVLNAGAVTTGWLVVIILALLADLAHWGGGYRSRRRDVVVVEK